jgi:hypothetical protein
MKQIQADANEGFLHIFGEFEYVRKEYGGQVLHEPRWSLNLFHTETDAKPMPGATEDDRIEMWNTRILIAQDGGFMFYADGDAVKGQDFHLSTPLPLREGIFVFHVIGDPAKITGTEDNE